MRKRVNLEELEKGRLGPLLLKYSWPALVAMSLNALYTVVDRFYIGHGCGEDAIAGLTLVFPIMMLFGAFGVFVGAGHSAALSIKLGEGDRVACEKLLGQLVALKLFFFFVLPPLIFFNLDTVLGWCGGHGVSPGALANAESYLRIVLFSHLFAHLGFGLSAMMRAEGAALRSMTALVIGFVTNLVLDPILIFGCGLGMVGAAWATTFGMLASCLYAVSYYLRGKSAVRLRIGRIRFHRGLIAKPFAIGLAPFLQQLLSSVINVVLPAAFAYWLTDKTEATRQIASLGVFQSVMILVILPILGSQQGLQPIFGYNWGARNFRRVREALSLGLKVTSALCVVACIVQVVPPFPRLLASLFVSSDNPALLDLAAHDLMLSNCMLWCIGLNIVMTTFFQSIGHPTTAIVLSTLRQGACLLPIACFLPCFMEDRTFAIWLSMPVSDVMCCLMSIAPFVLYRRFLSNVRNRRDFSSANVAQPSV